VTDWKNIVEVLTPIGALTGFIAFAFKAWEFYRDRRPLLAVQASLTSDPDRGNTILVHNASRVPTTIYNYSLQAIPKTLFSRVWPRFKGWENVEFDLEDQHADINVPAYGQAAIEFSGPDHFVWGVRRKDDLYLRLWIVGRRRPLHFLVARAGGS
jgi:hypothetical protein